MATFWTPVVHTSLQLVAHEVQLELIRLAHDNRAASFADTPALSTSALSAVALPSHVVSQIANAKKGVGVSDSVAQRPSVAPPAAVSVATSGNFLIAAAAQQRGSEMNRKRSRVAASTSAVSITGAGDVLASAKSAAGPSTLQRPYPVVYRCEFCCILPPEHLSHLPHFRSLLYDFVAHAQFKKALPTRCAVLCGLMI
jgi:hypothetical protein